MTGLSFVWPVAYDWRRAVEQVARLWSYGEHVVGWDLGGRTWGGGEFIPPHPSSVVLCLQRAGVWTVPGERLRFAAAHFYVAGLERIAIEVRNRNALTWMARPGNLIVTLDADEELIDPEGFVEWAKSQPVCRGWAYEAQRLQVYKTIGDVALVWSRTDPAVVLLDAPGLFNGPRGAMSQPCPARLINWWLAGRDENEFLLHAGAMGYARNHEPAALLDEWRAVTLENAHEVRGWAGQRVPAHVSLVPIAISDLRAGRWGSVLR